jgi:outer membrane protein assembly factor BamB
MWRCLPIAICLFIAASLHAQPSAEPIADFSFVQITDSHLSPFIAKAERPPKLREADAIAWINQYAGGPQTVPARNERMKLKTPPPAFTLATGDLTEYGVIGRTWEQFEKAFADLPQPLYVTPGNHDNTWVAMYHIMRQRHGGENYAFDHGGCHFACICSASPLEPVPTIDGKTRAWLKRDLERLAPGTPVFIALHHPLYSSEFANPAEYDTFIDLLRDYNVVLLIYGHGHNVSHRNMDGIDGVMGGSTYGKRAGYALYSVQDGRLHVAYHFRHRPGKNGKPGKPGWRRVLVKPLERTTPRRLFQLEIADPPATQTGRLHAKVRATGDLRPADLRDLKFQIDGDAVEPASTANGRFTFNVSKRLPGRHLLSARARTEDGRTELRTAVFETDADTRPYRCFQLDTKSAIKAGPVVVEDLLIVARTDGLVEAYDRHELRRRSDQRRPSPELRPRWTFKTGGEILAAPAWSGRLLIFGSGDGTVYALDADGQEKWTFRTDAPVYGWPLIHGDVVYVGDNAGRMHALAVATGQHHWTFDRADFAIESQPHRWGDHLLFGAWDGYLYALHDHSGELAWKAWGPKSSEGRAARYYAPADCGPVAIGDQLFVCDRGYLLGRYDRAGKLQAPVDEKISAIARGPDGRTLFARTLDDRICKLDAQGRKVWEAPVPAGRFPVPPTCTSDAVYVCSNRGLLSALDVHDGTIRWQYQVTPGFYVMAPVAVADNGTCYVAGMDGSLTVVRHAGPAQARRSAAAGTP